MNLHLIMSRVHSTFPDNGGQAEITSVVNKLEKAAVALKADVKKLESSIDTHMQGKTRDAFIDRIDKVEKKRRKIEEKITVLKGTIN
ncbi:hypothetical protein [Bacillus manliponensis]|uniref:hypothetical protein n=1 Tax=Bacillus manliponensis TaxID=574376 RepID=UPI003513E64F